MRRSIIATSLLLTASMPVLAQNIDALRDGLNHLPATLLVQQHGDLAYFVDMKVLGEINAEDSAGPAFSRVMVGADINALQSLARSEEAEWESKAGTSVDALRYFTGYGRPPNSVSFWGFSDDAAAADTIAALEGLGFSGTGGGVIGNGEPMRIDPQKRDPANPWRTMIGAAQFAAAKGSTVVQAQNPQDAMIAAADQPSLGDDPIIGTALAGLGQSIGDGAIVQAVVISPLFGMKGIDPASALSPSASIEETTKNIEAQMAALGAGISPYLGGIVADVEGEGQGIGIALAYPDCTIAKAAADGIALRWVDVAGEAAQGQITADAVEGEGGLCAATVRVVIDEDNNAQNPAYRSVLDAHFRNTAGVLQIGESVNQ